MFRPYDHSPLRVLTADDECVLIIRTAKAARSAGAAPVARAAENGQAIPEGGLRIQVYPLDDV
jgi:hypothetical protein